MFTGQYISGKGSCRQLKSVLKAYRREYVRVCERMQEDMEEYAERRIKKDRGYSNPNSLARAKAWVRLWTSSLL